MQLHATINHVSTGEHDQPQIHFSLHDSEDTGMVSFMDTIGLAHASFLIEHGVVEGDSAYAKMLRAFIECGESPELLLGAEFDSGMDDVEHEECAQGMHSWTDAVGKLPPDTPCTRPGCDATYGHPA